MNVSDPTAIIAFIAVVLLSLGIVAFTSRRNRSARDYYTAGGSISAGRNALALAGDFISAGGFLGLTGLIAFNGADAAVYVIGILCSWPLMLVLFAGPLKRLGRYTLADVLVSSLGSERLRALTAVNQIIVLLLGLTSNLVGSMILLQLLFGISTVASMAAIAFLMLGYVLLGGMIAATWLQIIKATLLMVTTAAILALALYRFDFSLDALFSAAAATRGLAVLRPGTMYHSGWETASLLLGLALGGASMPHVLMRMNTVADPQEARRSAFLATGIVVLFHIMIVLIGFAAMVLLHGEATAGLDKGGNLTLPLLAELLGGRPLLGVLSAIAFMTMLAVMAGQCIAGSAALSHDLWERALGRDTSGGRDLAAGRIASALLLGVALMLAYAFRGQNISFIAATSLAIAASANFPTLMLTLFWPRLTRQGAAAGMLTGLLGSIALISLSPLVQVAMLGRATAPLAIQYPGLICIPASFAMAVIVSFATWPGRPRAVEQVSAVERGRLPVLLAGAVILLLLTLGFTIGSGAAWLSRPTFGTISAYLLLLGLLALFTWMIAGFDYFMAKRR